MKKNRIVSLAVMLCISLALLSGCTSSRVKGMNATLTVSIDNDSLPESFLKMNKDEKKLASMTVVLVRTEDESGKTLYSRKTKRIYLKNSNEYYSTVYLEPGKYTVEDIYFASLYELPFEIADLQQKEIAVSRDRDTGLSLKITERQEEPALKEILNAQKFSHLVQISGKVYKIEELKNYFTFDTKNIRNGQLVGCEELSGLSLYFDDSENVTGISLTGSRYLLWGGMKAGDHISSIANKETGFIGKPDRIIGTPLIGSDIDRNVYFFSNQENKETIKVYTGTDGMRALKIEYRFR